MNSWFGLYYPHVHIRDAGWLKTVSLYLDGLYRFEDASAFDSLPRIGRTELALVGEGFLKSVTPPRAAVEQAADRFAAALAEIDLTRFEAPPEMDPRAMIRPDELDQTLARWKIAPSLADLLLETSTARAAGEGRLTIDPVLAHAYLLILGTELAPELGAVPLADDAFGQAAIGVSARRLLTGLTGNAPRSAAEERRTLLLDLAITAAYPRDLRDLPVHRIIDFRERYAAERVRFRRALDSLIEEARHLDGIAEPQILADHLRVCYETQVAPAVRELDKAMRGLRIDTVLGTINVQAAAPAAVTGSLALMALQPSATAAVVLGAGGLAIGVWASARSARRQRGATLAASPYSYLFHLHHDLAPSAVVRLAYRSATRFSDGDSRQ
ncbi:hypothetical protein FDA94_36295 [Herbidospora galbida]|uniref:Uncharacterized protein n=1 Tax=Herbidospora galbida TaxID=2575442 RepID=A0A4U3LSL7_9ACTN|nr:DUF6236 family protein [Herbidospora galbida]TKK78981.1 hypothetical protein FDA94_36295 [Herbidospora galbida]